MSKVQSCFSANHIGLRRIAAWVLHSEAERVFAERTLLLEENQILFDQNNEKRRRQSNGSKVSGRAKVMSYEDIEEAQAQRIAKEVKRGKSKRSQTLKFVADKEKDFEFFEPELARMVDASETGPAPVARMY